MLRSLMPLIQGFVLDRLLTSQASTPTRSKTGIAMTVLSGLCTLVGLLYVVAALSAYLDARYPADQAALLTACFVFALALIFAFVASVVMKPKKSKVHDMKDELIEKVTTLYESVIEEFDEPIRNNPKTAVAIAALAGFLIADRAL